MVGDDTKGKHDTMREHGGSFEMDVTKRKFVTAQTTSTTVAQPEVLP